VLKSCGFAAIGGEEREDSPLGSNGIGSMSSFESAGSSSNQEVEEGGVSAVLGVAQSLLGPYVGSDELGCWATTAARHRRKERI
jgi:hypothetical protein